MTDKYGRSKKYNRVYGNGIKTPIGRFSWPSLVEPKAPPPPKPGETPGQPRYEVQLVIAKDCPDLKEFAEQMKVMSDGMVEVYNKYTKAPLASVAILQDGDQMDHEKYPYYKNSYILTARNTEMPKLYNAGKTAIEAREIQAGQLGRLVVVPHLGPTGLSYRLEIAQLIEDDGCRFGGGKREYGDLLDNIYGESDSASDSEQSDGEETGSDSEENGNQTASSDATPQGASAPQLVVDAKAMRERAAAAVKEKAKANKTVGAGGKGGVGKQAAIDLL